MKKQHILFIGILLIAMSSWAQDYNYVYNKIYPNSQMVVPFQKIIEKENKQDLITAYKDIYLQIDQLVKERDAMLKKMYDDFEYNNPDPKDNSYCQKWKRLDKEIKKLDKRANQISIMVNMAKINYEMCKSDCNYQYNNYQNQINLYNDTRQKANESRKDAKYNYDKCMEYKNKYIRIQKTTKTKYDYASNDYNSKIKDLSNKKNKIYNEIVECINAGLFIDKQYHENGKLKSIGHNYWESGKADGEWKFYFSNGNLQVEGVFKNGQRIGIWKQYYENSKLKYIFNYSQGLLSGEFKLFYESGKLNTKGNYINDKKEGFWKFYYENGKVLKMGVFKKGEFSGLWKFYDENGQPSDSKTY